MFTCMSQAMEDYANIGAGRSSMMALIPQESVGMRLSSQPAPAATTASPTAASATAAPMTAATTAATHGWKLG